MQDRTDRPPLLPWYVHIVGGWSLGFLLPWYLTGRQFYAHGRKVTAAVLMTGAILLHALLCLAGYFADYSWDRVLFAASIAMLSLSFLAWLVQRKTFGPAPRRLYPGEWRNWLAPILIAVFFGICLSVILGFFPMMAERIQEYQAEDLIARKVILWDFFRYAPYSLLFSLPVGLWWAGERQRFSAASVVSYFFGLILSYLLFTAISGLYYFLLSRGQAGGGGWSTELLPRLHGAARALHFVIDNDHSSFFLLPLLLGSVTGLAVFWKRSLTIFPLMIVSFMPLNFLIPDHWQIYQQQIHYELASPDMRQRAAAFDRAEVLLARFPDHEQWPEIAARVADYRYSQGEHDHARGLYGQVLERVQGAARWRQETAIAAAALSGERFGEEGTTFTLTVPSLRYESYMTGNWMALIRNIRYYESPQISEADTLIRLKDISEKDDKISLQAMPSLAELYNNAADLGYTVVLLSSGLADIEKLIRAGYPVIQPIRNTFYLLNGIDSGRTLVTGSHFSNILSGLKKEDLEGVADASLFGDKAEEAPVDKSSTRIDLLAETAIPFSFWQQPAQQDFAPRMAVVLPPERLSELAGVLGMSEQEMERTSNAALTALIGLAALDSGDVVQAVSWTQRSYRLAPDPFPLRIAHLAMLLWQSRESRVASSLQLERQLPVLEEVERFLTRPETAAFLHAAGEQFDRDLAAERLDWFSRMEYMDFLDRSSPEDRRILIGLLETNVRLQPDSRKDWLSLADLHAWEKDLDGMTASYRGALEAQNWSDELALKVAYLLIQRREFAEADRLLARIRPQSVKYQPDYAYCLAALADWRQDTPDADRYYRQAIEMRRYDSRYHLDYARMLDRLGAEREKSEKLKEWSARLLGASTFDIANAGKGAAASSARN